VLKSLLETCIISICWYVIGFGFAFGSSVNEGIGKIFFAENQFFDNHVLYNKFMISWAYVVISFRIANTAVVERIDLHTSSIWAFFYSMFMFPIAAHFGWNKGGWLRDLGFIDNGGAGIVVLMGISSGLGAYIFIGKRENRDAEERRADFRVSNYPYIAFGAIIIWFTRFGFNASSLYFSNILDGTTAINWAIYIGRISLVTTLAPAIGGGLALFFYWIFSRGSDNQYSVIHLSNGIIMGALAVSGTPEMVYGWGGIIIGTLCVPIYFLYVWVLNKCIDDPINAIAANLTAGSWGLIAVGFLNKTYGAVFSEGGMQFGYQLLGMVIYCGWPLGWTLIIFGILRLLNAHKLRPELQNSGVDIAKCGGLAYSYDEVSARELANQLAGYTSYSADRNNYTTEKNDKTEKSGREEGSRREDDEKEKIEREDIEAERRRQDEIEAERERQRNEENERERNDVNNKSNEKDGLNVL
jgi:Amt family ammonium transporter